MSQASRSKVRARLRERERVAREIMHGLPWLPTGDGVRPPYLWSTGRFAALAGPDDLLRGDVTFGVIAAREHAEGLVALEDEQAVFEDWTRGKGLGPENREPYAFRGCRDCGSTGGSDGCGAYFDCEDDAAGGWPGKLAREWAARDPHNDRRAPMGRSLAKLGRAVLRALEGQPSECSTCDGLGTMCWDCKGTGHNLRGVLPDIEWPAVVRRKVSGQ